MPSWLPIQWTSAPPAASASAHAGDGDLADGPGRRAAHADLGDGDLPAAVGAEPRRSEPGVARDVGERARAAAPGHALALRAEGQRRHGPREESVSLGEPG